MLAQFLHEASGVHTFLAIDDLALAIENHHGREASNTEQLIQALGIGLGYGPAFLFEKGGYVATILIHI